MIIPIGPRITTSGYDLYECPAGSGPLLECLAMLREQGHVTAHLWTRHRQGRRVYRWLEDEWVCVAECEPKTAQVQEVEV